MPKNCDKGLNPDNSVKVPNDLLEKYWDLFRKEDAFSAAMDLIRQAYAFGVQDGRSEPSLYAVVPVSLLENKKISASAKLLYAEIMALSKKSGECFATNKYLSEKLGLSIRTIPRLINELNREKLLNIDINKDFYGTKRFLNIAQKGGYDKNAMPGMTKMTCHNRYIQRDIKEKEIYKEKESKLTEDELRKKKDWEVRMMCQ